MRIIGHLDMDAFFAAVEERDNPRLVGKPIVVGADPKGGRGRGVVSTANYKAREYGIKSALPISLAWKFSEAARQKGFPPAVFFDANIKKYSEVSERVMAILKSFAAHVEEASIDEAYFDLSFAKSYEKAKEIAIKIKQEIRKWERLTASVGIGPNKLVAKIAADAKKPDGFTVVTEKEGEKYLEPMSVRVIPGVGPKTEAKLNSLGIFTVKDAKRLPRDELKEVIGKREIEFYENLRGRDDSPITESWEIKSIGEQETFEYDTRDPNFIGERLKLLADGVYARFSRSEFKTFRAVTITVRFADFITKTRAITLNEPDSRVETIRFESLKALMPFFDKRENQKKKALRLIGIRIEKLA